MVVVTGRPAAEFRAARRGSRTEVWGLHGAERLHANGRRELEIVPPETHAKLDALCAKLQGDHFGGLVEEKPNAVAMHWRGLPRARGIRLKNGRARCLSRWRNWTACLCWNSSLAWRCAPAATKATWSGCFLKRLAAPRRVRSAYLGDDLTDEAAFRAIKERGLAVLARRQWRPTDADVWLRPVRCGTAISGSGLATIAKNLDREVAKNKITAVTRCPRWGGLRRWSIARSWRIAGPW